jgi:hypothetical protein
MPRIAMTVEEKKAKARARSLAVKVARQLAFEEKANIAREASLALMDDTDRAIFLARVEKFNQRQFLTNEELEEPQNKMDNFEISILGQFNTWGKLSENQINVIIRKAKEIKSLKTQQIFFEEYEVGKVYDHNLKLISHLVQHVDSYHYFAVEYVNVFRFENTAHQVFKIKTNNKKLIAAFAEQNKWYSFSSEVSFIAPDKKHICLKPLGLKLK